MLRASQIDNMEVARTQTVGTSGMHLFPLARPKIVVRVRSRSRPSWNPVKNGDPVSAHEYQRPSCAQQMHFFPISPLLLPVMKISYLGQVALLLHLLAVATSARVISAPSPTSFYEGLGEASASCSCHTHSLNLQGNAFVEDWLFLNDYTPRRLRSSPSPDSPLARATYRDTIFVHDNAAACISFSSDFYFDVHASTSRASVGGSFAFLLGDLSFLAVAVNTVDAFRIELDIGRDRAVATAELNHTVACPPPSPAFGGCNDDGGYLAMARTWIEYDAPSMQLTVSVSSLGLKEFAVTLIQHEVKLMCHVPPHSFVGFTGQGRPDNHTGEVHQITKWTFDSWLSPLDLPGFNYSCP